MAGAENKTRPTGASVAAFVNAVENDTRRRDAKALLAMMKKITGEKAKMWGPSIIGFGEYHYKYESGREGDMLNVGFSPRKANMALYMSWARSPMTIPYAIGSGSIRPESPAFTSTSWKTLILRCSKS